MMSLTKTWTPGGRALTLQGQFRLASVSWLYGRLEPFTQGCNSQKNLWTGHGQDSDVSVFLPSSLT